MSHRVIARLAACGLMIVVCPPALADEPRKDRVGQVVEGILKTTESIRAGSEAISDAKATEEARKQAEEREKIEKQVEDLAAKVDRLEKRQRIAAIKQNRTNRNVQRQLETEHPRAMRQANRELADAKAKLDHFLKVEKPLRLERAEMGFQVAQDRLQDDKEELAQLERMYGEDDLADETKDIVLNRARRSVDRAEKRLKMEEVELKALKTFELPNAERDLRQAVERKEEAVADLKFNQSEARDNLVIGKIEAELSLLSTQEELKKHREDLAEAQAKLAALPGVAVDPNPSTQALPTTQPADGS